MIDTRPDDPPELDEETLEEILEDALKLAEEIRGYVPQLVSSSHRYPLRINALRRRAGLEDLGGPYVFTGPGRYSR